MGKIGKNIIRYSFFTIVIVISISFANYKTKLHYKFLQRLDIINTVATGIRVNNIVDIFPSATKKRKTTKYIVVHCDAIEANKINHTPLTEIYNYHKGIFHTIAYHYYITRKGKLYKLHNNNELTAHAKGVNSVSISVCLQGNFDKEYLKAKQKNSLIKTLILLKKIYPDAKIIGHCDVSSKTCPGIHVNVDSIRNTVSNFHILNLLKKK